MSDGQLLARFVGQRDHAAFEALVKRQGPMVLGVCRRVLGNLHDADDAFQATFLILVHKASSLKSRDLVGNWLYGVAYNTALAARAKTNRVRAKEVQVIEMPEPAVTPPDDWSDLDPRLDHELSRLAGIYRVAIVLCVLEGKSRNEAAQKLGIPEGTMSSRLAAARRQLAKRLAGRGLTLFCSAAATLLEDGAGTASVPAPLAASTLKAAATVAAGSATAGAVSARVAALTEGVLKTMFLTKAKPMAVVALALFLIPALLVSYSPATPLPARGPQEPKQEPPVTKREEKKDVAKEDKTQPTGGKELDALAGTWTVDTHEFGTDNLPKELMKGYKFVFAGDKLSGEAAIGMTKKAGRYYPMEGTFPCDFKIDPGKTPKEIDLTMHLKQGDRTVLGIYEIKDDGLKLCIYNSDNGRRPIEFSNKDDRKILLVTLIRAKK